MGTNLENEQEQIIRYIVSEISCNHCGGHYAPKNIFVLDRDEDMWLLVARCPSCDTYGLVIAVMDSSKFEVTSSITEQSRVMVPPISEQEVRAWYDFIECFEGDMHDLLAL